MPTDTKTVLPERVEEESRKGRVLILETYGPTKFVAWHIGNPPKGEGPTPAQALDALNEELLKRGEG